MSRKSAHRVRRTQASATSFQDLVTAGEAKLRNVQALLEEVPDDEAVSKSCELISTLLSKIISLAKNAINNNTNVNSKKGKKLLDHIVVLNARIVYIHNVMLAAIGADDKNDDDDGAE
jgi:hypothetical protein